MTWSGAWARGRAEGDVDVDVVLFGDSITAGQASTSYATRSFAARLRAALRGLYGDGGGGFTPHQTGAPGGGVLSGAGTTGTAFTPTVPNGHVVTLAGGARWSHRAEGTEVAVYLRRDPAYGTARWRVDGGPWQTVSCTGAAGYVRASAAELAAGLHTVDVEPVSGTVGVAGAEGRQPGGCRVHLMGLGGRTSGGNSFTSVTGETSAAFRAATISRWAPHLLVHACGVNDSNATSVTPAAYESNVRATLAAARAVRSDCDVLLVGHHLGRFVDTSYDAMLAALRAIADDTGAVVLDLDAWARTWAGSTTARTTTPPTMGTSWGRWATWGWWHGGSDAVHPGDVGHQVLAHLIGAAITDARPDAPPPPVEVEFGGLVT